MTTVHETNNAGAINTIRYCSRCIMNSTVEEIEFDEHGVCNFCHLYDELDKQYSLDERGKNRLTTLINQIREDGKGKNYDCIIGVSGGTDSTYILLLLKKVGLRPLAVHFDNGWNTEISVSNIKNSLEKLGIELSTYVVDWEEFKDLQLSFLKASVPEVELPTDLAIRAVLYKAAADEGLKYVIEATSFRTEGVLPLSWGYKDGLYVKSIQKRFGSMKLESYPNLPMSKYGYYTFVKRIKLVRILNYFEYNKEEAKKILSRELGWVDYGGHHFESIYTRFFQSYLAPQKFGMDRRMVTLSAQINSHTISRDDALKRMNEETISKERLEQDKAYIAKKFQMSVEQFDRLLEQPPKSVHDYPSYYPIMKRVRRIVRWMAKKGLMSGFFQSGISKK
jgi:N-acetyl sugar amidotransferase